MHASDYVLMVLGAALDRILCTEAPGVDLRYLPNAVDDAGRLREGTADMAIGVYGDLPPEIRTRKLCDERLVRVVRKRHPVVRWRMTLEQFVALAHVQVAPRGRPGGYVDDVLAQHGRRRRIARAVPDYILTAPRRAAASDFGLRVIKPPLPLDGYTLTLIWHPRSDSAPAHK